MRSSEINNLLKVGTCVWHVLILLISADTAGYSQNDTQNIWNDLNLIDSTYKDHYALIAETEERKSWYWVPITGGVIGGGVIAYILLSDEDGNKDPEIRDTTPPVLTCPPNLTIGCHDDFAPEVTGIATAVDDVDTEPVITYSDRIEIECTGNQRIIRTWLVSDRAGNDGSCEQVIQSIDTEPPSIACPGDIIVACHENFDPSVTGTPETEDNCSPPDQVSLSYTDDLSGLNKCNNTGSVVRTWHAIDACGNAASCIQTLTIIDNTAPEISCPEDVNLICQYDVSPEITGWATAVDLCTRRPEITYVDDTITSDPCAGLLIVERQWQATDSCLNMITCIQKISVSDSSDFEIICPNDTTIQCGTTVEAQPEVISGCRQIKLDTLYHVDDSTQVKDCEGHIERTWYWRSACFGNDSCKQKINIYTVDCLFSVEDDIVSTNCGRSNGEIKLSITPSGNQYQLSWQDGSTEQHRKNLLSGTYSVTITDTVSQCSEIFHYSVPEKEAEYIEVVQIVEANCGSSGNIILNLSGEATSRFNVQVDGPVNFSISGVGEGIIQLNNYSFIPAGSFRITVYDEVIGVHCDDRIEVSVPGSGGYQLLIETVINPSSPSSNDGRIILVLDGTSIRFPVHVFVNDVLHSITSSFTISIDMLGVGLYTIYTIDDNGRGCRSEVIEIELFAESESPWQLSSRLEHTPWQVISLISRDESFRSKPIQPRKEVETMRHALRGPPGFSASLAYRTNHNRSFELSFQKQSITGFINQDGRLKPRSLTLQQGGFSFGQYFPYNKLNCYWKAGQHIILINVDQIDRSFTSLTSRSQYKTLLTNVSAGVEFNLRDDIQISSSLHLSSDDLIKRNNYQYTFIISAIWTHLN